MVGILIIAHGTFGESLIHSATHVLGVRPPLLLQLGISLQDDPQNVLPQARKLVRQLDQGNGVLVLTDVYGATPANIAAALLIPGRVEGVAGVSLPMLVRALTYRTKDLPTMIRKAVSGGCEGVLHIEVDPRYAAARG